MFKKIILTILLILSSNQALGAIDAKKPIKLVWPFEGIFGTVDRQAAQRGAQVYFEVCAACHGNRNLYYRNLKDIGFSEEEIKAIAARYSLTDGPNADGEMFERPATAADNFVSPYPNEEAARAAHNGAYPVDLSLIVKARANGANYLYSLLVGYSEMVPSDFKLQADLHYNPYFEGKQIAMPAPLSNEQVTYMDGTPATIDQMSRDLVVFLQWAAEPEMEHRKSMGLRVMIFLIFFTIVFYLAKRNIWKKIN